MFDRASIVNPVRLSGRVDVGRILDAMLYYNRIDYLVDARSFSGLLEVLGPSQMETLLSFPSLSIQFTPEMPAVMNNTKGGITAHNPIFIMLAGSKDKPLFAQNDTAGILFDYAKRRCPDLTHNMVRKMVKRYGDVRYDQIVKNGKAIFESLISDLPSMKAFIAAYARSNGIAIVFEKLAALQIDVQKVPDGFVIFGNMAVKDILPEMEGDEWGAILPLIHDYQIDLYFSQARSADIITNETNTLISSQRLDLSINRALHTDGQKTAFEEFAFNEARPFGTAFNEGKISLDDALRVIDQTEKFRSWLTGLPPDADVIQEYHKAVNRDTILGKLPGRTARFSFFTGAGIAADIMATGGLGTAVGLGLSAFDSFVLDGLVKGWRPNNFVGTIQSEVLD